MLIQQSYFQILDLAASSMPELECFYNIESTEEHVLLEKTRQKLDELLDYLNADDVNEANDDGETSVSSESEITTTDDDQHNYTQIKSTWSNAMQAMHKRRNHNKRKKLAKQKLCKEKPPNKRATKDFVPCPWKELDTRKTIESYVQLLCLFGLHLFVIIFACFVCT